MEQRHTLQLATRVPGKTSHAYHGKAMKTLRILVVDDSPVFLRAAVGVLTDLPCLEIVGEAGSGSEALALAEKFTPNLVLTDLAMPQMDGLELTRRLMKFASPPEVVIMTAHTQPEYHAAARAAGASGFVLKPDLSVDLPALLQKLGAPYANDDLPIGE